MNFQINNLVTIQFIQSYYTLKKNYEKINKFDNPTMLLNLDLELYW